MKPRFEDLVALMTRLRAPGGCPWDRKQTHESLLRFLREESREVSIAVRRRDWENLKEELGDVLLQVLFHAELARESGRFDIGDVLKVLRDKLVRRHPHVFGPRKGRPLSPAEVLRRWDRIKAEEKGSLRKASRRRQTGP